MVYLRAVSTEQPRAHQDVVPAEHILLGNAVHWRRMASAGASHSGIGAVSGQVLPTHSGAHIQHSDYEHLRDFHWLFVVCADNNPLYRRHPDGPELARQRVCPGKLP